MRYLAIVLLFVAGMASANDTPAFAPPPAWVTTTPFKLPTDRTSAPSRILLVDEQVELTKGSIALYRQTVVQVQTAAGLAEGNIAVAWRPEVDTITIHKLNIKRGEKLIDAFASGKKFTVLRREPSLEAAIFDGQLTATLQLDGLEVGDIIDMALTVESRDPSFDGHVEAAIGLWNGVSIDRGRARIRWPNDMKLRVRANGDFPASRPTKDATGQAIEINVTNIQPLIFPRGAPARYSIGRIIEASDFSEWGAIASLFAPLYAKAATIDPRGDLARQVDAIAASSRDPAVRATAALALVQGKVRYLALAMGSGSYVPQGAEETWKSRLGECKAKTALLVAILRRLNIDAVPVLVSTRNGDGLDQRIPLIGLFDHVLVRTVIKGRTYWLDGTRAGDGDIARLETPDYYWGLPVTGRGDRLEAMRPAPHSTPDAAYTLRIDARAGVFAPAPAEVEAVFRGDTALLFNQGLNALPEATRDAQLRDFFKQRYSFIEPSNVRASFDPVTGTETLTLFGTATMKWDDGFFRIPGSSMAFKADFARPSGSDRDAPFTNNFPAMISDVAVIQLPSGITLWPGDVGHDIDQTLAGVAYRRTAKLTGNELRMEKSERAVAAEIPAAQARAAQPRLLAMNDEDVHLKNSRYTPTDADMKALMATEPDSASSYFERGLILLRRDQYAEAIVDLTKAHDLKPKDGWILANRGVAHTHLGHLSEAESDFVAAELLDRGNPVTARGRATAAFARGDFKAALAALDLSMQREPDNGYALLLRARIHLQQKNPGLAQVVLDRILARSPDDREARLLRANAHRDQKRDDLAMIDADVLARAPASDDYALSSAAQIYGALNRRDKARALLDKAIAAKPSAMLHANRAELRESDDIAGRRADLDSALRLQPDADGSVERRGIFALDHDDPATALSDFATLIAKYPKAPLLRTMHGLAQAKAGKSDEARKDFVTAATLAKTPSEHNAMCWEMATRNLALETALAACERALAAKPDMAAALDSRGFVALRLGRLDGAIADYDAALKIDPEQAASLFGRALAYHRKGNAARAAADRAAAIKLSAEIAGRFKTYGLSFE